MSHSLSANGVIGLPNQTYRVVWDGKYCAHVHLTKETAYRCLVVHDRAERERDKKAAS